MNRIRKYSSCVLYFTVVNNISRALWIFTCNVQRFRGLVQFFVATLLQIFQWYTYIQYYPLTTALKRTFSIHLVVQFLIGCDDLNARYNSFKRSTPVWKDV
jgi:hypothetical protein